MLFPNVTLNRELIAQLRREILEGDWDDSPWENIPESKVKATVDDITTTNCFNPAETDDVEQIRQEVNERQVNGQLRSNSWWCA